MKKTRIIRNIIKWCLSIFCFLGAVATISKPNFGSVLLLLLAAAELPIKPVDDLWEKIIHHPILRIVKRIVFLILFVIAAGLIPEDSAGKEANRQEILLEEAQRNGEEEIAEAAQGGDAEQSNTTTAQQGEAARQSEEALTTEREASGQSQAEDAQQGKGSAQSKEATQSQSEITGQSKDEASHRMNAGGNKETDAIQGTAGQDKGETASQAAAGQSKEAQQSEEPLNSDEISGQNKEGKPTQENAALPTVTLQDIPAYAGNPYTIVGGNRPFFTDDELVTEPFETYSELDSLGRCGAAYANICIELMPTEERGSIGMIKPCGWQTIKYDFVDGKYLYNRCHLIGFQLAGENANTRNLITGTRYFNTIGMLPFENQVASYVERTDNHVLYRVTPLYEGENLVANGVLMEAKSVEDKGEGICFCVFCYNVQPGVVINYADGTSREDGSAVFLESTGTPSETPTSQTASGAAETAAASPLEATLAQTSQPAAPTGSGQPSAVPTESPSPQPPAETPVSTGYVLNMNTHKFHRPDCSSVGTMKSKNRQDVNWTKAECEAAGYEGCKNCNP